VNPTVLVIEDEADIRQLIRINLELDGYDVLLAVDGAEGLAAVKAHRPDVIVLDVMLPSLDGWEVLTQLKAGSDDRAAVPVLMLTARTDAMDRLRGGIEGALHYLTKPFSPPALRDAVQDVLTGPPEPIRRRRVQRECLSELARIERGQSGAPLEHPSTARPHLTRLEAVAVPRSRPAATSLGGTQLGKLSEKQCGLLAAVGSTTTVREAAERLNVSRSNVYASLRRIARKLGVRSVAELVRSARDGGIA
jgi:CheY-like chemotaxis protein/DNA-binding CsgD family transcriptional regulator